MAINNKIEATTGPDGVLAKIPTNGSNDIQASNFHSYLGDLINWLFPNASTNKGAVLTASEIDYSLEWKVLTPVGTIIIQAYDYAYTPTIPDGWLLCNGSEVLIATYTDLYNQIQHSYNLGVTATAGYFKLPKNNMGYTYLRSNTGGSDKPTFQNTHGGNIVIHPPALTLIKY